ncbi:MAG: hypothetical protein KJN92_12550 [Gemmatimonadetes bacterium]|nr:hypothetical protein [Gemmatimonadota bacterium]
MRSVLPILGVALILPFGSRAEGQTVGDQPTPSAQTASDEVPGPQLRPQETSRFSVGGFIGFQDGLSFQGFAAARDFAQGFPLQARFRIARTSVEPGSAPEARRIFINDATNGTPKEAGVTTGLGLDGIYPMGPRTNFFGGIRYTRFKANFKYVGGNEDFDVTSTHWGLAAGLEAEFPMGPRLSLLVSGGGEYFFSSRLSGHDTSYSPDGDDVNPRKDYTYNDADDAVDQPILRPVALLGFSYRLGG